MSNKARNVVIGATFVLAAWAGCSSEDESGDGNETTSSTTSPSSTGSSSGNPSSSSSGISSSSSSSSSSGTVNPYECNPITNEPCGDSAACDLSGDNTFVCFSSAPNDPGICETCDQGSGPWCQGGMNCLTGDGFCRKYCCDDSDCGPTLYCEKGFFTDIGNGEVGICIGDIGGSGGSGGSGGAGGSGGSGGSGGASGGAGGSGGASGGAGGSGGSGGAGGSGGTVDPTVPGCDDVPVSSPPSSGACIPM